MSVRVHVQYHCRCSSSSSCSFGTVQLKANFKQFELLNECLFCLNTKRNAERNFLAILLAILQATCLLVYYSSTLCCIGAAVYVQQTTHANCVARRTRLQICISLSANAPEINRELCLCSGVKRKSDRKSMSVYVCTFESLSNVETYVIFFILSKSYHIVECILRNLCTVSNCNLVCAK